ncbi:hypothetical protein evm_004147 [Chilo suppressalis]|nr:hypothetical protein evm_004147 [Chilo suppressalis]
MSKIIRSGTRKEIFKVFQRCFAEYQAGRILWDLDDVYGRTASMTGKSQSTVRRIVNEGFKNDGKFETPGNTDKADQRKKWTILIFVLCAKEIFYTVQKEVPTLRKLQVIARTELGFDCSLEVLRKILKAIGFSYKKCYNKRRALIEQTHIAAKREEYLAIIQNNRDLPEELRKDIIYLDESYIHSSYKVTICWQYLNIKSITKDISKGKRFVIVHAGSEKGFVPNCLLIFTGRNKLEDYHSEMNAHNFTKWIKEKLKPNFPEPSIIVMDNAPYHSEAFTEDSEKKTNPALSMPLMNFWENMGIQWSHKEPWPDAFSEEVHDNTGNVDKNNLLQ